MPKRIPIPPPGFDDLPIDEQIDHVQSPWERIAVRPEQVPVPPWHQRIVRERLDTYKATPTAGRPWAEVQDDIKNKPRDR